MNFISVITLGFGAVSNFIESAPTQVIFAAPGLVDVSVFASTTAIVLKFIGMAIAAWMTTVIGVSPSFDDRRRNYFVHRLRTYRSGRLTNHLCSERDLFIGL
jgi:hypothetical protein